MQTTFTSGELSPSLHARVDLAKYQTGLATANNAIVHAHGGISNRSGWEFIAATKSVTGKVRLIPFRFNTEVGNTYILEFGHLYMRVHRKTAAGVYDPDGVVEIASPYTAAQLSDFKYVQSADVMFIAVKGSAPRKLSRTNVNHLVWVFSTVAFNAVPATITGVTKTAANFTDNDRTRKYRITQVNNDGRESLGSTAVAQTVDTKWPTDAKVTLAWTTTSDAAFSYYNIYCALEGDTFGFLGTAETNAFVDDNITPDLASPLTRDKYSFSASADFPSNVAFHEQRLLFAGLQAEPQAIVASNTGDFVSFSYTRPRGLSDAFKFQVDSGVINEVRHVLSMNDLVVMTAGANYRITDNGDGFAFENISSKPQGNRGASKLTPLVVGNTLLYTLPREKSVHALTYSEQSQGYDGLEVSIMAKHMLDGQKIVDWTYQQEPDSIVWSVMSDGTLTSLTYVREHEVSGWCRHNTAGTFEAIASIEEGEQDAVYAVVKRNINGSDVRYIERLREREVFEAKDAFFVDSGKTYSGSATTTITGLGHLEGETVSILADGNVVVQQVVASGQITLPAAASLVHVGLPYVTTIETLEPPEEFGKRKSVALLRARVYRSRGMWVGPNANQLTELRQRAQEQYGEAIPLFTGLLEITLDPTWEEQGNLYIQQRDPLPLTLIAVIPDVGYE